MYAKGLSRREFLFSQKVLLLSEWIISCQKRRRHNSISPHSDIFLCRTSAPMHTAVSLGYYLKGAVDPVAYFPREIFSPRPVEGREFPSFYLFSVYADIYPVRVVEKVVSTAIDIYPDDNLASLLSFFWCLNRYGGFVGSQLADIHDLAIEHRFFGLENYVKIRWSDRRRRKSQPNPSVIF